MRGVERTASPSQVDEQRLPFHRDGVGARPDLGVHQELAGADVELPAMPGAADDLVLPAVDEFPSRRRACGAGNGSFAEACAAVRADIEQRVIAAFDVEDPDRAVLHRDDLRGVCRSEEHTSELQSRLHLVCRLLLEKKKKKTINTTNHATERS